MPVIQRSASSNAVAVRTTPTAARTTPAFMEEKPVRLSRGYTSGALPNQGLSASDPRGGYSRGASTGDLSNTDPRPRLSRGSTSGGVARMLKKHKQKTEKKKENI